MELISSRKNNIAVHLKKLGAVRSYRLETGEFLCDGYKLLEDAARSGAEIVTVLTADEKLPPLPSQTLVYKAPRDLIDSLSPLKNAQDVLFSCKLPKDGLLPGASGRHILLDGIQDPGNLGTIIRTADAFGFESVMLTGACADAYNPKTVRASMGAIFRQSIIHMSLSEIGELINNGTKLVGAALGGERDIRETDLSGTVIAIGSEGSGLSEGVLSLCSERIKIPIMPDCESLNAAVAAGIMMWEASRVTALFNGHGF